MLDAVVIGAGAAGLTAGYELSRAGLDIKILEASNRIGGRVGDTPASFADFGISIGGEWIHVKPNVLNSIVNDPSININVPTVPYAVDYRYWWGPDQEWSATTKFTGEGVDGDSSFVDSTWFQFFETYIAPETAGEVELGCAVTEIEHGSSERIEITCANGSTYETKAVIVTASIGILNKGIIEFTPALSAAKRQAFSSVEMSAGMKVFIKFTQKFYFPAAEIFDDVAECTADGDMFFYDATYSHSTQEHVMGVYIHNELADPLVNLPDDKILEFLLKRLDEAHAGQATQFFTGAYLVQNWSKEPFVGGTFSSFTNYGKLNQMLQPESNNRIYFAGEAFDEQGNNGFVHGAALSGQSAAERLLDNLSFPSPAPTSSPVPSVGGFCFSGATTVQVESGESVRMSDLNIGDVVLVDQIKQIFEPIYSFGHYSPQTQTEYLRIATVSGAVFEITDEHMVFLQDKSVIPASQLATGDEMQGGTIDSIKRVQAMGAFAPFTPSGRVVVGGGIQASSFVAHGTTILGLSHQWLAHTFEFPHRVVCYYWSECPEEQYTEDGMSTWVALPYELVIQLEGHHWLVRTTVMLVSSVTLLAFAVTEWLLSLVY